MADNNIKTEQIEKLFQAVEILADAKLSQLEFDKTLICTIESIKNAEKGEYQVTDGSTHFTAFSENTQYAVGAKVYVNIPNGDMNNQKIIKGKYVSTDNDEYYNYVSPLENFIDVTNNLIENNYSLSLLANNPIEKEKVIVELSNISYKGYERLGISGSFQTWLKSFNTANGSYGIRLDIVGREPEGANKFYSYTFNSNEMYGNPYDFAAYFKQEKVFNISHINEIVNIRLVFYQDDNFINENKEAIPYAADGINLPDNIFLKDVYLSLGYSLDNFTEDKVLLGTHASLSYNENKFPLERSLYMRWVHQDGDKFYSIDKEEEIPENAVIHWYRYKLEQGRTDELAGTFWKEITEDFTDKFNYTFTPDINTQYDMFKCIIEYPSGEYINNNLTINEDIRNNLNSLQKLNLSYYNEVEQSVWQMCNSNSIDEINLIKETILNKDGREELRNTTFYSGIVNTILAEKAKIVYYTSDVLEFVNEIAQEQQMLDLIQGLSIDCDLDGGQGVYRLYDETNSIINTTESSKKRQLTARYNSIVTGESDLDKAEEIVWYFPKANTMIEYPLEGKEFSAADGDVFILDSDLEGYCAIQRKGSEIVGPIEDGMTLIEINQYFRIKKYYTQTASNNTIYCVVIKNGRRYEASTSMIFGTTGSNGTEATFLLTMLDSNGVETNALTLGESIKVKPSLYDFNNKLVDISNKNIKYGWYTRNSVDGISLSSTQLLGSQLLTVQSNNTDMNTQMYYILKAEIQWSSTNDIDENGNHTNRNINLTALLPIAVRRTSNIQELEGATKIVYDTNGVNPSYYKNPYKLYQTNSNVPMSVNWVAASPDFIKSASARRYYPALLNTGELTPTNMYYSGLSPFCVYAMQNNNIIWVQPVIISQNRYASAMLNGWSGELTIDEKNGTILSTMIGAGVKNSDNSFSGVLMGDVDEALGGKTGLGIYGFDKGEQSYGFNVDGTAFIGKSGKGRIEFDGNNGTITSGNYKKDEAGIKIDLDDSFLNAYGDAGSFEMNMNAEVNQPLLQIKDSTGNKLLYISGIAEDDVGTGEDITPEATKYYIQSSNYSSRDKTGLKIDLQNSQFTAFGLGGSIQIDAGDSAHLFRVNSIDNNPLINISGDNTGYFLRSNNYSPTDYSGLNFDLSKGKLTAYDFTLYTANRIADGLISSISISSSGNPYFRIHHASEQIYENVPVFKIYEPNIYYYLDNNGNYVLDTSSSYTENRNYYNSDHQILNIVDKNLVYNGYNNVFYVLNEKGTTVGFELVSSYIPAIQYYSSASLDSKIEVVNNAYAFEPNKYYVVSENNEFALDNSEYYTDNRNYYDSNHNEVIGVLDNTIYRNFYRERNAGNLYTFEGGTYILDTSSTYTNGRIYYSDSLGSKQVNIVPDNYEIFIPNTYYQKIIQDGVDKYYLITTYYSNIQYYKDLYEDEEGNQHATPVNVASPESVHYVPNKYYYYVAQSWKLISSYEEYDQNIEYAILIDGEYRLDFVVTDSNLVYWPGKYYYIIGENISYVLATTYDEKHQYYLDSLGTNLINVVLETSTLKVFKPNKFYRYYNLSGNYVIAEGEYNSSITYYKLLNPDEANEANKIYESVEVFDADYEFEPNIFYIYVENADNYVLASQFTSNSYYILSEESQENDLIRITKSKFELKSHDWNISEQTGMHFDISGDGGYIEGYGQYTNLEGIEKHPRFILDWRKNRNPIDINNGVFKVKWSGEVTCTNLKATGGKIANWNIRNNALYAGKIYLQASGNAAGIYVGNIATSIIESFSNDKDANGDDDSLVKRLDSVTSILNTSDKYFRLDADGDLQVYNASISNLVTNTISTKYIYVDGRKFTYRKKKTLVGVSIGSKSQEITIKIPEIGVNRSAMKVSAPAGGGECTVTGLVKTRAQTVKTTATLTTVSGKSSTIYYLGTG